VQFQSIEYAAPVFGATIVADLGGVCYVANAPTRAILAGLGTGVDIVDRGVNDTARIWMN